MGKGSDYFLSLDDKSKQRYKVKINNIQLITTLIRLKKGQLSRGISKFPPVQWYNLGIVIVDN